MLLSTAATATAAPTQPAASSPPANAVLGAPPQRIVVDAPGGGPGRGNVYDSSHKAVARPPGPRAGGGRPRRLEPQGRRERPRPPGRRRPDRAAPPTALQGRDLLGRLARGRRIGKLRLPGLPGRRLPGAGPTTPARQLADPGQGSAPALLRLRLHLR